MNAVIEGCNQLKIDEHKITKEDVRDLLKKYDVKKNFYAHLFSKWYNVVQTKQD